MQQVNIHEAKTHLSALVEQAANGKSFVIAKAGKPLVKVVPYTPFRRQQRVGFLKGQVKIPNDFDRYGEVEIVRMFEETK